MRSIFLLIVAGVGIVVRATTEEFHLYAETVTIPEVGGVTGFVLQSGGMKYSFIPPRNWNVTAEPEQLTIRLLPDDLKAGIKIKIVTGTNDLAGPFAAETLRILARGRYPNSKVVHEFECYTGFGPGFAFDLDRTVPPEVRTSTRLVFVGLSGGYIEFELTAPENALKDYHVRFGALLNSFQVESGRSRPYRRTSE